MKTSIKSTRVTEVPNEVDEVINTIVSEYENYFQYIPDFEVSKPGMSYSNSSGYSTSMGISTSFQEGGYYNCNIFISFNEVAGYGLKFTTYEGEDICYAARTLEEIKRDIRSSCKEIDKEMKRMKEWLKNKLAEHRAESGITNSKAIKSDSNWNKRIQEIMDEEGVTRKEAEKILEGECAFSSRNIKSEFEIGDDVIVTDESQDLNEVEGTVTDIVDDKAEVVFKSGEDSWVDLDKIESACHGKSKKDKKDKKKKSIKSSLDENTYQEFKSDMFNAIAEVYKKYNFNTGMNADKEDFDKVIEWMDIHGYWDNDDDSMM